MQFCSLQKSHVKVLHIIRKHTKPEIGMLQGGSCEATGGREECRSAGEEEGDGAGGR